MDRIVVAGATGFIGHAVSERLAHRAAPLEVVGLTRGRKDPTGAWSQLVTCDLFSLKDVERALRGARYVAYLVHSMLPSARLVQGRFEDLDLICADNVGRAARTQGVEQIVYLGGLIPPEGEALSRHLESRREVERALGAHGVAVTTLRAGLVIGPGGSSFEIVKRLVERLPAMILPAWSARRCQPIDLGTVAALIDHCVGRRSTYGQTFDIGGPEVLRYRDLIAQTAEELGRPRPSVNVPVSAPALSRGWISLVTGAPKALVAPLIESLRHDMVCRDRRLQDEAALPGLSYRESVRASLRAGAPSEPHAYRPAPRVKVTGVRSVQRIPLPRSADAEWAAHEYMRWLPRGAWWAGLSVRIDADRRASFSLLGTRRPLLELTFAADRSARDRQLFYVTGGLLAAPSARGRLEMRETPDGEHLLTAIHDFVPRLPWPIYRLTQAWVHRWVMYRFGAHLARLARQETPTVTSDRRRADRLRS